MIKAVVFDMYETLITLFESPLYFGAQMAADAGMEEGQFLEIWRATETDRTTGKITFEEVVESILRTNGCYSEEKMELIVGRRIRSKEEAFEHIHRDILPMLKALKDRGILVGLISNCFSEETKIIKKSVLYPYFDAVCLSFDEGLQKPDPAIYKRCLEKLDVQAGDCLYVGDGGSDELEAAQRVGMGALQATWYLKEGTCQPSGRKDGFRQLESPLDILDNI